MMTKHVFGIPEQDMTIIAGDVGGSYGMKGGAVPRGSTDCLGGEAYRSPR